jgi:ribosomal protein S18 acetylase RimI-like enzyme
LNPWAGAEQTPTVDTIEFGRDALVDEAAQIWAEATATRDGVDEVPALDISRPVIKRVLSGSDRAFLLVARAGDGTAAGFAAIGPAAGDDVAEVEYLGVRPGQWGRGIGEALLAEARRRLRSAGYARAELSVYSGNQRAVELYERLGWRRRGQPTPHPRTGKAEQRYELTL